MKKKRLYRGFALLAAMALGVSLLSGCAGRSTESLQKREDAETIQVYLWTATLYEKYAPYVQAQLPDVNIEFIVGNNDLDFYKFLQQNGGLPDIITCCRFSLHDAAPLKDSLMNLATTNEAGAIYNIYLNSFKNEDGSVNWLPVCPDAHGFVVNRDLFAQYDIPLPNDYAGFVAACKAFEEVGIRGYTADYLYDYTCMETLQGLSAAELMTTAGCCARWGRRTSGSGKMPCACSGPAGSSVSWALRPMGPSCPPSGRCQLGFSAEKRQQHVDRLLYDGNG